MTDSGSAQRFAPYVVADSGRTVDEVFDQVNTAVWLNYGPDLRVMGADKPVAAPLQSFVSLLESLTALPHVDFVDHVELHTATCAPDRVRIALRHDIDSDIVGAVAQAEIEAEFGVRANWVVLHTAPYYGFVDPESGRFVRNDAMATVYRGLQDLGHEVSLHNDPLHLYQDHGIDGAQAVTTEIAWLRDHGVNIRGTTAHNFRARYGAENYEIFTGVVSPRDGAQPADATSVEHNGTVSPLRVLDETELGLVYEGNQAFWDPDRELVYGSVGANDTWYWADGRDPKSFDTHVDQTRLLHRIKALECGTDVVLVVHPEYLAARSGPSIAPFRRLDHVTYASSPAGWTTYTPDSIVAQTTEGSSPGHKQSCNMANEWGMLDRPIPANTAQASAAKPSVLLVGSSNLDGRTCPSGLHANRLLANIAAEQGLDLDVVKLAHPGFAIDRQWAWIRHAVETLQRPIDLAVLGISASALDSFGLDRWSPAKRAGRQKGRYLARATTGRNRGRVREYSYPRQRTREPAEWQALVSVYEWVVDWLRSQDIEPLLLVEEAGDSLVSNDDSRRDAIVKLATDCGASLIDPTDAIAAEQIRLGQATTAVWDQTAHRIAAGTLAATILPRLGVAPPVRHSTPARVVENHLDAEQGAAAKKARVALGLLDYPSPFTAAVAFAAGPKTAPANAAEYAQATSVMVEQLGLDYGEGIPLADHHQRYAGGRKALSTSSRAVLTHHLRRDNAPLSGRDSWLAHVLAEFHRGNLDYLHGLSNWGVRSLPLDFRADNGPGTVLISPFAGDHEWDVPYALNAADFPVALIAVESASAVIPATLDTPDGSPAYERVEIRSLAAGTALGLFAPITGDKPAPLEVVRDAAESDVPPQHELPELRFAVAPVDVVSAAMHNLNAALVGEALLALNSRFDLAFDLIVANHDYGFYAADGLDDANARFERTRNRRGAETPIAVFGAPASAGRAAAAVTDHPESPAYLAGALSSSATRFIAAHRAELTDEPPVDLVTEVIDRSGADRLFMRRPPLEPTPTAGSRLLTPDRFRNGSTEGGGDQSGMVASLATDHYGGQAWFTRASVLANFHHTLSTLPGRVTRSRIDGADAIDIDPLGDDVTQLFGVSFNEVDPIDAIVRFGSVTMREVVRWLDRDHITLVPCGIRWPLIDAVDPVLLTADDGDLRSVTVTGRWTWGTDPERPSGRLELDGNGQASIKIELGDLDVAGAQIATAAIRVSDPGIDVRVRFITGDGSVFEMHDAGGRPGDSDNESIGRFATVIRPDRWNDLIAPFWGYSWSGPQPTHRSIRHFEITAAGPPGESVSVGEVWLGRPRAENRPGRSGVLLGGDALGHSAVSIRSIDSNETWECAVEADGLFVSPRLEPGAYAVMAQKPSDGPDTGEHLVQVMTDRFDLRLGDRRPL